jgi:hypothetical protein
MMQAAQSEPGVRPISPSCKELMKFWTRLKRATLRRGTAAVGWEGPMGVKWTARLKVDFEMDEGVSAHLAEACVSAAEFQRFIEIGTGNGNTRVKPGSQSGYWAQGQIAW